MVRDFNKNIGWEIPGGYILDNENIEDAVHRVVLKETGLEIDETEPVAIVKNLFTCGGKSLLHIGIAFVALSRGKVSDCSKNIKNLFTKETSIKTAYQNDKIIIMANKRIAEKNAKVPSEEIDSVKKISFPLYIAHNYIIKPIGSMASNKIDRVIFNMITERPDSVLDVSCGDSSLLNKLRKTYNPKICMGNDISWKIIKMAKKENLGIIFTNHNILNLPYKKIFDLVIFKNTLHHLDWKNQTKAIDNLKKISKQLIIVDIDDPKNYSFLSKIWNFYYKHVLGDCGKYFLSFEKFKKIIDFKTTNEKRRLGVANTVKGRYFFISIEKQKPN
ncbi:MAG: methyltransferase domain-containing protein [Candidatus Paceibacter sp.]|nr:methyltransferase domain-containing protein [Candidatus Paceibacter sp.]